MAHDWNVSRAFDMLAVAIAHEKNAEQKALLENIKDQLEQALNDDPLDDFNYVGSRHHY